MVTAVNNFDLRYEVPEKPAKNAALPVESTRKAGGRQLQESNRVNRWTFQTPLFRTEAI